ncbi:COG1470 family protein [Streptomyces sp. A5-4]|uniref:COG1470 family protein n=1 Tax=Streptomyces sp. A5-4 TaxID=3384771 RepID=UPI003DA8B782
MPSLCLARRRARPAGRVGSVAGTLLCAVLLSAPTAPAAPAADGGPAWTAAPSGGRGDGRGEGRPYFYLEGAAGTVLQDKVSLANPGSEPRTVRLRGADAYNARGGAFAVREKLRSTGTGAWIALATDEVRIPPRTRAEVPFSVTVPQGATPGDHPGAVVVTGGGREVGVRIHLRVSGPTLAALTVEDVTVGARGDAAIVRYALVNRGNTALTPRLALRARGLFGELLRRDARTLPVELLPGQRVELTEPWPDVPTLDRAEARLTVTAAGGAHGEASAVTNFVPWSAVAGAGALLLAAGGAAARLIRRRRRQGRETAGPDADGDADGGPGAAGREETGTERQLARAGARS